MLLLDHHVYVVRLSAGPFRTAVAVSIQLGRQREDELAAQARQNPFALFMQVELEAARQAAPADRLQRKVRLLRQLYAHGYDKADFHRLFAFLDSAMVLPPALELQFV